MGRGRKPLPTNLKILSGVRDSRINSCEPEPPKGRPDRPEFLDDIALAEWDRIVPILEAMGVLTKADGQALEMYCGSYSLWKQAFDAIKVRGLSIETEYGIKNNPAIAVARESSETCRRILIDFGCTPSSRSKVKSADGPKGDTLDSFFSARRKP